MSTMVLYYWCHGDSASVLLYFTDIALAFVFHSFVLQLTYHQHIYFVYQYWTSYSISIYIWFTCIVPEIAAVSVFGVPVYRTLHSISICISFNCIVHVHTITPHPYVYLCFILHSITFCISLTCIVPYTIAASIFSLLDLNKSIAFLFYVCLDCSWHSINNYPSYTNLLTQGYRYHKLRKTFGKFFRSYSELLSKFGEISFQEYRYVSDGIFTWSSTVILSSN